MRTLLTLLALSVFTGQAFSNEDGTETYHNGQAVWLVGGATVWKNLQAAEIAQKAMDNGDDETIKSLSGAGVQEILPMGDYKLEAKVLEAEKEGLYKIEVTLPQGTVVIDVFTEGVYLDRREE